MSKLLSKVMILISLLIMVIGCSNPNNVPSSKESSYQAPQNALTGTDFREESIYFLLPTRFYDGDTANNVPNEWCSYDPSNPNRKITDPNDVTWRGDFKGLITKGLDYIKDLGFTAVWLTPVVQNRGPLDYHGYHAWDFAKVDPRLESPGYTYQDFINAAHAKGIKVVQDVVWNHSGRFGIKGVAEIKYNTDPLQSWGKDKNGVALKDNPNWSYDGKTKNPDDNKIWSRANLAKMPAPYNANLALYNWPSTQSFVDTTDINWFHHSGNGFAQGWDDTENLYNRALAGDCPDLNTESTQVRNYLVNAYKKYLDMGVDAFRVDTVKHIDRASIQYFVDQFKAYKPNLFIFGEVAQKRHELHNVEEINPHWYTWRGAVGSSANSGMAVLDFYAEATMHNQLEMGGGAGGLSAAARYDHLYSEPTTNIMWLDNHDFGPNNDWNRRYGGSDVGMATYVNFAWTWRGIPSLYYGSEIQFMKGAYTDIHEAADIEKSLDLTGRAYYGDNILTASSHKLYQHTKKMNQIRRAVEPLQKGSWTWAGSPSGDGLGYTRTYNGQTAAVGIAMNGSAFFTFTGLPSGTYKDAVTGKSVTVSNGTLKFTVNSGSAGVFVQNGTGMIGALGAGFFQSSSDAYSDGAPGTTTTTVNNTAWTAAYFRGTPNNWAATAMTKTGTYTFETTQTFSGVASPRFKIDRNADWVESYPTADYTVTDNKTYKIVFNSSTKVITATEVTTTTTSTTTTSTTTTTVVGSALKVHVFKNSYTNWTSFYCYFWGANGSIAANQWPGDLMTSEGNGWYLYTVNSASSANMIFNNGSGTQTVDLTRSAEGWFVPTGTSSGKVTGTWYSTKPVTTTTTTTTTTTIPTTTTTTVPTTTTTTVVGTNITLKMTKDVGSGYSLFFTGSVTALTNWGTGKQGTWSTGNVWQLTIANPGTFEWKVRKGVTGGTGNTWESGTNHNQSNLWPAFNGGF